MPDGTVTAGVTPGKDGRGVIRADAHPVRALLTKAIKMMNRLGVLVLSYCFLSSFQHALAALA